MSDTVEDCGCDSAKAVVERAIHELDPNDCARMQLGVAIAKAAILIDVLAKEHGTVQTVLASKIVGAQLRRYLKDHSAEVQAALRSYVASSTGKTH